MDKTDQKILSELSKDSSISIPKLAEKINVNSSVVYSRIKRLVKKKLIDGNIFNVGRNENNFSKLSIIKLIIKKMKKGKYQIVKNSKDRRNYIVNFSKIKKILKFSPKLSISYGITEILSQFKKRNIKLSEINKLGNYRVSKKFL